MGATGEKAGMGLERPGSCPNFQSGQGQDRSIIPGHKPSASSSYVYAPMGKGGIPGLTLGNAVGIHQIGEREPGVEIVIVGGNGEAKNEEARRPGV